MATSTKNDLARVGLFSELGYVSIGDPFKDNFGKSFNVSASKGKQMLPGSSKTICALQVGYFDKQFNRIMEGEAYTDPVKRRRQERLEKNKLIIGKAFIPSHAGKKPSGVGSYFGTLSGPIQTFSPLCKDKDPYVSPGRNFVTNPGKKGSGYGYANVLIGKPQKYAPDPYNHEHEIRVKNELKSKKMMMGSPFKSNLHPATFFDSNPNKADNPSLPPFKEISEPKITLVPFKPSSPGKQIGGSKAGCFTSYPSHSDDLYNVKKPIESKEKHIFRPSHGAKTMTCGSIIAQNITRRINCQNFNEYELPTLSV
ncbi:cilia-and flagella-associated protein 96 isoform X2 [Hydra vulgaris]|uniref:Cilia-and flagella-associated protein 96 n=1 Tax=Hydra vulgaris TaxID=6087 RepID=A0ABM4BR29_HYDVU